MPLLSGLFSCTEAPYFSMRWISVGFSLHLRLGFVALALQILSIFVRLCCYLSTMTIIYDDISALCFYRCFEVRPHAPLSARQCRAALKAAGRKCAPTYLDEIDHGRYGISMDLGRICVLVPGKTSNRKSDKYAYKTWEPPLLLDSLLPLDDGVYVVSPEMLFLHMAQRLDWLSLTMLGLELCGRYRVGETGQMRKKALTTPHRLKNFVDQHPGKSGVGKAKRALQYVVANSYSPMESKTFLLLCLPRVVGGHGLPFAEFNARIEIPPALSPYDWRSHLEADLYWSDCRGISLAVEYDSDEYHSTEGAILRDSRRAATLSAMGVTVVVLRKQDVFNAEAFEAAAAKIALILGVRQRSPSLKMEHARIELRKRLLFDAGLV